jgi:hypothetical protein
MLFSVGYTLPYDRSGVIFSLSQVQNFPGDEGDFRPLKTPQTEGATSPFWQPPWDMVWEGGRAEKVVTFLYYSHFTEI